MKQDKVSALRQRLKRGSFEFGALLEGVSTLEEERREDRRPPEREHAPEAREKSQPPVVAEPPRQTLEETFRIDIVEEVISDSASEPAPADAADSLFGVPDVFIPKAEIRNPQLDRLRTALESLGCRFLYELGAFRAAVAEQDVEQGGFHLAHLNQVLDLLRDIDPDGDMARDLETVAAPPPGRGWPAASWTVVELASSPFSALLQPSAGEGFVRDLLYAAWGVTFEPAE